MTPSTLAQMQEWQNSLSAALGAGTLAQPSGEPCPRPHENRPQNRLPTFRGRTLSPEEILILLIAAFLLLTGKDRLLAAVLFVLVLS